MLICQPLLTLLLSVYSPDAANIESDINSGRSDIPVAGHVSSQPKDERFFFGSSFSPYNAATVTGKDVNCLEYTDKYFVLNK